MQGEELQNRVDAVYERLSSGQMEQIYDRAEYYAKDPDNAGAAIADKINTAVEKIVAKEIVEGKEFDAEEVQRMIVGDIIAEAAAERKSAVKQALHRDKDNSDQEWSR